MSSAKTQKVHSRKVILIGDGACGKTSLLDCFKLGEGFATNGLMLENVSTFNPVYAGNFSAIENYTSYYRVDGRLLQLAIWDSGTQEQYERHMSMVYLNAHTIIVCFSITDIDSLENIKHRWIEEVMMFFAGIPIIMVGLKNDLRSNKVTMEKMNKRRLVTELEGRLVALEIGAKAYIECSSLSGDRVDDVLEAAARAALTESDKCVHSRCTVF